MKNNKSLLGRIVQIAGKLFGDWTHKNAPRTNSRTLQVETLESRELLSVVGFHSFQDAVEGEQSGYVRLQRDDTVGELTVNYEVDWRNSGCAYDDDSGWAKNGTDFSWLPGTSSSNNIGIVTFANGEQYADIVINASEGDEGKKVVEHQWQLKTGKSSEKITDVSTVTKNGTGTITTVDGESYSITTTQTDVVDYKKTVDGKVCGVDEIFEAVEVVKNAGDENDSGENNSNI